MSLIFQKILGPLVLGWAPNHLVLGAQLAPGEKRFVYIPVQSESRFTVISLHPYFTSRSEVQCAYLVSSFLVFMDLYSKFDKMAANKNICHASGIYRKLTGNTGK